MKKMILGSFAVMLAVAAFARPMRPCTTAGEFIGDQADCAVFYVCNANLVPEFHLCPSGLEWNDQLHVCDYPESAGCSL